MQISTSRDFSLGTVTLPGFPAPESASPIFDRFQQSYALVNNSVVLNYTTLASDQADVNDMLQEGGFLVPRGHSPGP